MLPYPTLRYQPVTVLTRIHPRRPHTRALFVAFHSRRTVPSTFIINNINDLFIYLN